MVHILNIIGSGIAAALMVLITQLFASGRIDILPIFLVNWGSIYAAFGFGGDPIRANKVLFVILLLQSLVLLVVAGNDIFRFGYNSFYLYRGAAGLGVLVLTIFGYMIGKKNE